MPVFKIDCLVNKTQKNQGQYGKFVLEPLERGQGITMGNSLRRVLLSNLEGAAVTAVTNFWCQPRICCCRRGQRRCVGNYAQHERGCL